ncbi:MAG: ubiquinone biosynthesis accessory factor UbiJ [Steroidobacteraceae bacterium]
MADEARITIASGGDVPADATIEGTAIALARLALDEAAQSVRSGGVQLSGDAEIAQAFQRLFIVARPELEEELSHFTGDVAAHHLANFAREALEFARKARRTFAQNVAEYLTEESHDVPARPEVEEFLSAVDSLREATDRLDARLAALERGRSGS